MSKYRFLLITSLVLSASAGAHQITIKPDDYALDADLSKVSNYATLQSVDRLGNKIPIRATPSKSAATAGLTFGNHGIGCIRDDCNVGDYEGFGIFFNQEVSDVSLLGTNWGYSPGLQASWVAFDQAGHQLTYGNTALVNLNETILIDIHLNNIWSVFVGGGANTAAFDFDDLAFNVDDTPVPVSEPSEIALLLLGFTALLFRAHRPMMIFESRLPEFHFRGIGLKIRRLTDPEPRGTPSYSIHK